MFAFVSGVYSVWAQWQQIGFEHCVILLSPHAASDSFQAADWEDTLKVLRTTSDCIFVQLHKAGRHLHSKKKIKTHTTKDLSVNQNNGVWTETKYRQVQQKTGTDWSLVYVHVKSEACLKHTRTMFKPAVLLNSCRPSKMVSGTSAAYHSSLLRCEPPCIRLVPPSHATDSWTLEANATMCFSVPECIILFIWYSPYGNSVIQVHFPGNQRLLLQ